MTDTKSKMPFYLIDTQSAFYRPKGRRVAVCLAATLWAVIEAWHRDPFWMVISVACAAYCFYVLLITYHPPVDPPVVGDVSDAHEPDTETPAAEPAPVSSAGPDTRDENKS